MSAEKPISHSVRVRQADQKREFSLAKNEFLVGRDPKSDVFVDIAEISRRHALVRISDGKVFVRDLGSANGTFIAGRRLRPEEEVPLTGPDEEVSLAGRAWLSVTASPPLSVSSSETKPATEIEVKNALAQIEQVQIEAVHFCENLKQDAQRESQVIIENTKREAAALKVEVTELSSRATELRNQVNELRDQAMQLRGETSELRTQRETLTPIVEDLSAKSADCRKALSELDALRNKSEKEIQTLNETRSKLESDSAAARSETERSSEEARRASEKLAMIREDVERGQRDLQRAKEESEIEARKRNALTEAGEADFRLKKISLETQIAEIEFQRISAQRALQDLRTQSSEIESQKIGAGDQVALLKMEAHKIQASIEQAKAAYENLALELEKRKEELAQADGARLNALAKVEVDAKEHRSTLEKEIIEKGREMERQLADAKLKEMEKIARMEKDTHEQHKGRSRLMASEIARVVVELSGGRPPDGQGSDLTAGILGVLEGRGLTNVEAARRARTFWRKTSVIAASVTGVGLLLYLFPGAFTPVRDRISRTIASEKANNGVFLNEIKERGSSYQPPTDKNYRDSYSNNILYLQNYVQMKTDEEQQKKWTLALNDFLVGKLGLSDRVVPDFVSQEMILFKDLVEIRQNILLEFKDQGIARMIATEKLEIAPILKILETPENYDKFRAFEKNYYEAYAPPPPAVSSSSASSDGGSPGPD